VTRKATHSQLFPPSLQFFFRPRGYAAQMGVMYSGDSRAVTPEAADAKPGWMIVRKGR
jgi:hypothetical protein